MHSNVQLLYLLLFFSDVAVDIDADSPAFSGRLTLFCLVSRSHALVLKSLAFHVH